MLIKMLLLPLELDKGVMRFPLSTYVTVRLLQKYMNNATQCSVITVSCRLEKATIIMLITVMG